MNVVVTNSTKSWKCDLSKLIIWKLTKFISVGEAVLRKVIFLLPALNVRWNKLCRSSESVSRFLTASKFGLLSCNACCLHRSILTTTSRATSGRLSSILPGAISNITRVARNRIRIWLSLSSWNGSRCSTITFSFCLAFYSPSSRWSYFGCHRNRRPKYFSVSRSLRQAHT